MADTNAYSCNTMSTWPKYELTQFKLLPKDDRKVMHINHTRL